MGNVLPIDLDFPLSKERKTSVDSVVLEEQMAKVGETGANYKLATNLYRKHIGMLRMALGTK